MYTCLFIKIKKGTELELFLIKKICNVIPIQRFGLMEYLLTNQLYIIYILNIYLMKSTLILLKLSTY